MTFTGMGRHKPHRRRLSPVQLLILAILKKGPAHGYIIIQKLGQRLGPRRVKSGTIYPALHRLVEKELIHGTHILQEDGPDTVEYRLTPKGRKVLSLALQNLDTEWGAQGKIWRFLVSQAGERVAAPLLERTVRERSPIGFAAMKARCEAGRCSQKHLEFLKQYRSYLNHELEWVKKQLDEMKSSENEDGGEK
ncbi:MAG: PadR family transcriptional regulator [Candidatus Thorarchaeota archaeon]|jgi:DNA-binding PadR family transcriptional regulator